MTIVAVKAGAERYARQNKTPLDAGLCKYVCRSDIDYFLGAFADFFAAGFFAAFGAALAAFFGGAIFALAMVPVFFLALLAASLPFTIG
jgi:hypothetical protein